MKAIILFIFSLSLIACDKWKVPGERESIYKGYYYELIKAISKEDTEAIYQLISVNHLNLNHRDSQYHISLLSWSLFNYKKISFLKLLQLGANPNFKDSLTPMPIITLTAKEADTDYLHYCLIYRGDPNIVSDTNTIASVGYSTPLSAATALNISLLIKHRADVNYLPPGFSLDFQPLAGSVLQQDLQKTKILLLDYNADPFKVKYVYPDHNDTLNICDLLRRIEEDLNSNDYKLKMEIIKYLKDKYLLDYFAAPVPENVRKVHDSQYLSKY